MSNNDLTIRTRHADRVQPIAAATPHADRIRWASALAAVVVVGLVLVMAGCGGDAGAPAAPTSLAPGTAPAATSGAGVPLEPGSNLPPVEGDDETITTNSG